MRVPSASVHSCQRAQPAELILAHQDSVQPIRRLREPKKAQSDSMQDVGALVRPAPYSLFLSGLFRRRGFLASLLVAPIKEALPSDGPSTNRPAQGCQERWQWCWSDQLGRRYARKPRGPAET